MYNNIKYIRVLIDNMIKYRPNVTLGEVFPDISESLKNCTFGSLILDNEQDYVNSFDSLVLVLDSTECTCYYKSATANDNGHYWLPFEQQHILRLHGDDMI